MRLPHLAALAIATSMLALAGGAPPAQALDRDDDLADASLRPSGGRAHRSPGRRTCRPSDAEAFKDAFLRNQAAVESTLRRFLRNSHDVEDATQQVFLQAFEALPRFVAHGGTMRGWLVTIAANVARNARRSSGRVELSGDDVVADLLGGARGDPDGVLLDHDEFCSFLRRLPPEQRTVVYLRYGLDYTPTEVAAVLDRSPDAVSQLQRRALAQLRLRAGHRLAHGAPRVAPARGR